MLFAGLAIAVGLTITSCKKGDTGPQGPAGPQGPQGATGNNGVSGIINTTLTAPANTWSWDNTSKTRDALFINVTALSQSIINSGAIMLYEDFGSGTWVALPQTFVVSANLTYHTTFFYSLNTVGISRFLSDESDPGQSAGVFRLVVIPQGMVKPNVNIKDYNAVKDAYNLKD